MKTIRLGSTGTDVLAWQSVIEQPLTGTFDEATEDATRTWQAQRGLEPDGIVGPRTWGVAGLQGAAEREVPVVRTTPTMAEYVRAVMRAWPLVGTGLPLEQSIGVLWAQYMIETGGKSCFGWNLGNAKHFPGDGHDYHCLRGAWEGVSPGEAARLIASGEAIADASASHAAAVGKGRVSVIFVPPHRQTWFRAFPSLDAGMREHLQLLAKRFSSAWPAVLAGDTDGFARALKARGYFTADAGAYAAGMRRPFAELVASTTYEEMIASMHVSPETTAIEVPSELAVVWDVDGELEKLVTVAHGQASGVIVEDMLDAYRRSRIDET